MNLLKRFIANIEQFALFEKDPVVAVAVSGGPDSMVLLELTDIWIKSLNGKVIALTVDHKIRADSFKDCLLVEKYCKNHDIDFVMLEWNHGKINGNLLEQARNARFNLLTDYCNENDILHLLVAHHLNDFAENFIIKILRDSGIRALAVKNYSFYQGVRILKPLHNVFKSECIDYAKSSGIEFCSDPSNNNIEFLRSRIRNYFGTFEQNLIERKIRDVQDNLLSISNAIKKRYIYFFTEYVCITNFGYAIIKKGLWEKKEDLRRNIISYVVCCIGGSKKYPRAKNINNLFETLQNKGKATLNHALCIKRKDDFLFVKEQKGRPKNVLLAKKELWDMRFICEMNECLSSQHFSICLLEDKAKLVIKSSNSFLYIKENLGIYAEQVLKSLPAISVDGRIVAVPHFGYFINKYYSDLLKDKVSFRFRSRYVSDLIHY